MGGLIKSFGTAELGWFLIPVSVRARANITAGTLVEDLRPFWDKRRLAARKQSCRSELARF
jgi:hypothetical protein